MRLINCISLICLLFIFGCKKAEEKDENEIAKEVSVSKDLNRKQKI